MSHAISLNKESIRRFWEGLGMPANQIITMMERSEDWTADDSDSEVEEIIDDLAAQLSCSTPEGLYSAATTNAPDMLEAMAYMSSGRAIAMFRWLSSVHPDIVPAIVMAQNRAETLPSGQHAEETEMYVNVLLDRVRTLERVRLLSTIFSPERLSVVIETLEAISRGEEINEGE